MILLALDLATATGWCYGDTSPEAGHPELGNFRLPATGEEVGPFIEFFDKWLSSQMEFWNPDLILFEAPVLPQQAGRIRTSIATTRKLQGLAAYLEFWAYRNGFEITEVANNTAKKALGHGKFSKHDMMAAARRAGMDPASHDEADAFGIWMAGLKELDNQHQAYWDSLLFSHANLT